MAHEGHTVDQVISLRYPAYALRHPQHVVWLNHRMREYYDLWEQFSAGLSWKNRLKEGVRRALIHRADRYLLQRRAARLFVISATVQARLQKWGGYQSTVLYPPPPRRPYRTDGYGDFIFGVSRLHVIKRFDLVIRALAEPIAAHVRVVIAGEGSELPALVRRARQLDVDDRVTFLGRCDEATLVDQLARCRAVVFPTFNEDYGFVTVEAFSSAKAVITCRDSGGPAELVRDGENGLVTDPTPEAMARALYTLSSNRQLAMTMGEQGGRDVMALSWPAAVDKLLL